MTEHLLPQGEITSILARELGGTPALQTSSADAAPVDEATQVHGELESAALASRSDIEAKIKLNDLEPRDDEAGERTQEEIRALRDRLMKRAAKQRQQGAAGLVRVDAGVTALSLTVQIKTKVLGSAFQRWFSAIDQCAANLQRRGEMLLGDKGQVLLDALKTQIDEVEAESIGELERMKHLVNQAKSEDISDSWVTPHIEVCALSLDGANIRSKLGHQLYKAVRRFDDAMELADVLVWNDQLTDFAKAEQELQYKKSLGKLYGFAAHTNLSLFRQFTARRNAATRPPKANDAGKEVAPLEQAA
ncbi:hypothetical protein [Burkholderia sp. Ac-20365]|uniref:hypothetical protein n=1 Tax=Burkholderia sp. Ac-20365 TaxID=2703897 RepID=UPI00197B4ED0|nr:hypothetical protein [Burkholderia sp. Ac-20365]MBN3760957.1 hypothetical protein [Burkholderia sp. Ac-20365]